MKELKKTYRAAYNELKQVKGVCNQISNSIDQAKQQLVAGFEQWYDDNFDTTGMNTSGLGHIEAWFEF